MAIAPNPKRKLTVVKDAEAESFISGAGKPETEAAGDETKRKPVVVRIPADLLKRIDAAARKKAISRSAFIVSSLADLVNKN